MNATSAHLLQRAEGGIPTREIQPAMGGAEGGKVSQSQVLWQQQTLGQAGLLALTQQLHHLCVQAQFCGTQGEGNKHGENLAERLSVQTHWCVKNDWEINIQ